MHPVLLSHFEPPPVPIFACRQLLMLDPFKPPPAATLNACVCMQARDHPVTLDSFEPPPGRRFEQGLSRKEAQRIVQERQDKEMAQKR